MGLIHILDTEVSNKIAAGEVVERPLSIVKELVENSIDAGATVITIEIRDGGIKYIRVTDNGSGMSAEDAKICFLRHATSKIQTGNDLEAIYTLGFRGEALSSIGAVAKVRLYTKRSSDETGVCVTCEGGEILSSADAGAPNGTVIEVSDLFYNTPARLKFLKKSSTEAGYIADIVSRYVFAHPEISFKLISDNKEKVFTSGDNRLINSIYAVYGRDYAKNMLDVDYQYNSIVVKGVIGKGTLTRANRSYQSFFVNGRYIKSPLMIRALEEAYKNQIMISKFPTAILNIEIDAAAVDINVHPTKLECKFSNEQEIYQAVYHAVKSTLYALPNVPEIERTPAENIPHKQEEPKRIQEEFVPKFKTEQREIPLIFEPKESRKEEKRAAAETTVKPAMPEFAPVKEESSAYAELMQRARDAAQIKPEPAETKREETDMFAMLDRALQDAGKNSGTIKVKDPTVENSENAWSKTELSFEKEKDTAEKKNIFIEGGFRVIGQLFETYILVEQNDKLLMIDQHAAHERLNFEALKAEIEECGVNSQMILEPIEVSLSGEETAVYCENRTLFTELGFSCEESGDKVVLTSIPGDIAWSEAEPLFLELLTQIRDMNNNIISKTKERLLYTISCKAAIKANMEIGEAEMESLVKKVFALENINTCPHGRPIVISMSKKEIEKDFKRIV